MAFYPNRAFFRFENPYPPLLTCVNCIFKCSNNTKQWKFNQMPNGNENIWFSAGRKKRKLRDLHENKHRINKQLPRFWINNAFCKCEKKKITQQKYIIKRSNENALASTTTQTVYQFWHPVKKCENTHPAFVTVCTASHTLLLLQRICFNMKIRVGPSSAYYACTIFKPKVYEHRSHKSGLALTLRFACNSWWIASSFDENPISL